PSTTSQLSYFCPHFSCKTYVAFSSAHTTGYVSSSGTQRNWEDYTRESGLPKHCLQQSVRVHFAADCKLWVIFTSNRWFHRNWTRDCNKQQDCISVIASVARLHIPVVVIGVVGTTTVVTAVLSPAGALGARRLDSRLQQAARLHLSHSLCGSSSHPGGRHWCGWHHHSGHRSSGNVGARRLSLMMALGSCSSVDALPDVHSVLTDQLDLTASPTGMLIGPEYGAAHRGAVIGNLIKFNLIKFICVAAIVAGLFLTIAAHTINQNASTESHGAVSADRHEGTLVAMAATLRLPGLYFFVVALFFQQMIVSSTLLLVYPKVSSWQTEDRALGTIGLLISVVLIASMARVLDPRSHHFRAVPLAVDSGELSEVYRHLFQRPIHSTLYTTKYVVYFAAWMKMEKVTWTSRAGGGDALFVERYGFLFEECDGGRQIALSGLSALVPESIPECLAALWSSVAVSVSSLFAHQAEDAASRE
ncbi:transmembrane protein, putative, partial [Bodo saltans]